MAKVIYIDFGLVLWLSSKLLRKLPEKLMYYSRQAISCRLKDVSAVVKVTSFTFFISLICSACSFEPPKMESHVY